MGLRVVMGNSAPAILANHDRDRHASAMVWCLAAAANTSREDGLGGTHKDLGRTDTCHPRFGCLQR
jgi:hypothetical protein